MNAASIGTRLCTIARPWCRGPWRTGSGNAHLILGRDGRELAELRPETTRRPYRDGEVFATAKLLAASPVLYEALAAAVAAPTQDGAVPPWRAAAEAALREADGGSGA